MVKKKIAIIPARGGSKRIPQKNIIDFLGKPMIAWTIESAINTEIYDRIIVSTDSEDIAEISKDWGAEVPFLRENYADDYSPVSLATLEALRQAEKYYKEEYYSVTQLMANTPLRTSTDILEEYKFFKQKSSQSVISCFKYGWMNPWWAHKLDENNKPKMLFPETKEKRSQDLSDLYCPTGATWIAKSDALKKYETFYTPDYLFYEMNWKNSVDIDTYEDLNFAKAVFQMSNKK